MKAVNLLPQDLRRVGKPASSVSSGDDSAGRWSAIGVLGALMFCVVALTAYVLTTNTIKSRQVELDRVTADAAAVTQQAARLKPYADAQAEALQRVATVKDLAASRFDWEQALRDVSRAIPADVTLTQLSGTVSGEAGGGGNPLRSAITAPALELQGCAVGQRAVATLMARVRNVDGVTRVTLAKSERPEAPTTATGTSSSATAGCGKGRPPAFDLVAFFERDKVPATVQDVTVASGGGTGQAASTTGATTATSQATPTPTPTPAATTTG